MSLHGFNRDRVTVARLCGTATRYAHDAQNPAKSFDQDKAVAELVEIATERGPVGRSRLRVDLLSDAAGSLTGAYRHSPINYWSACAAARLLIAAGADPVLLEQHAADTVARLTALSGRSGIGNR